MKYIFTLFVSISMLSYKAQAQNDPQSQEFIRLVNTEKGIVVYSDRLLKGAADQIRKEIINALSRDTIFSGSFPGRAQTEPQSITVFSKDEKQAIINRLDEMTNPVWERGLLSNSKIITADTIGAIFKDRDRGWSYFNNKYGESYYNFSKPIFIRNNSICIFYMDHSCGHLCGYGELAIYTKKNGIWEKSQVLYSWIS